MRFAAVPAASRGVTRVCVYVFLLYSIQLGGQRSPLSTTALMVYLAHS